MQGKGAELATAPTSRTALRWLFESQYITNLPQKTGFIRSSCIDDLPKENLQPSSEKSISAHD